MRSKIKLLLTRRDGVTDADLDRCVVAECEAAAKRASRPVSFLRAYAIPDPDLYKVAAGAFDAEEPFDALVDIAFEGDGVDDVLPLLEGFGERFGDVIDPARSAALAGREYPILPGEGPVLVTIANRRLTHYTHEGFLDYWLAYHGPFAREHTPPEVGLGYRQFHANESETAALLSRSGLAIGDFDGAAECRYRDADAVRLLMGMQQIVDEATEDEKEFVDHARCVTSVMSIVR